MEKERRDNHNLLALNMVASAHSRLANLQRHFQTSDNVGKDGLNGGNVKISPEVAEALSRGDAVVALESTIISHGMPYPQNLETAKELEAIVRNNGAVPATIAILDGIPCIGLTTKELERLANLGTKAQKTARRDIAYLVASRGNGATTVSATMFFASMETQGVTVAAYKTDQFPAFFTETSGCKVPCRVDSPEDCARLIDANLKLGLGTGILIAVPIPKEHAASGSLIESAIQKALQEARDKKVTGNAETPFLLARVNELTGGASLASNIALVKNNALVGAKIAVAHARMRQ
ncbi:hypothetical protein AQUCO_09300059v1 [Aquilegia coerulea]|uniref:Pseudouridine-5'-phosphate glycosidase n=1 Tax=Aquilegia coerulea TaxID=218851 RepID=A0A2G5C5C5_AQUCA|nr:hypothetical protein AQUCO_09300059v1 [Aquilegia coerulea]